MKCNDAVKFGFGDTVFFKLNTGQPGLVVAVIFYPGNIAYRIQWEPNRSSEHYEFELTTEKSFQPN